MSKSHSFASTLYWCESDQSASTDNEKASLFNHYFYSVLKPGRIIPNYPPAFISTDVSGIVTSINFSADDVYLELSKLDPSKATGLDVISSRLLKYCALALYIPIHHVFKLSINSQSIPSHWKVHCIVPVLKSGDKSSVRNYQPISLLSIISMTLERIAFDHVSTHIFVLFFLKINLDSFLLDLPLSNYYIS